MTDVLNTERKYPLSKPITTHAGVLSELTLKAPTGSAFIKHGVPFKHLFETVGDNRRMTIDFDARRMFGFLSDMTGIDVILLEGLDGGDVFNLFYVLVDMLGNSVAQPSASG